MKHAVRPTPPLGKKRRFVNDKNLISRAEMITKASAWNIKYLQVDPNDMNKIINPHGGGGGGRGTQQSFIRGGSAPRSDLLPFYIPFLTEEVPLSHTQARNLHRGSPIGFFNPVTPTQNFRQSRNPEGYFWHPASRAYFQSTISPRFRLKIPNPEPQIREIPHPEKLIGDPLHPFKLL